MRATNLRWTLSHLVRGFVLVLLLSPEGTAQIPQTLTYQGKLNGMGMPVSDTLSMTFAIYDQKMGGSSLWTETHPAVTVDKGQFSVELGSVTPLTTLAFDVPYFLGIKVGNDMEMNPRLSFTSVGYALNSVRAQSANLKFPRSASVAVV